MSGISCLQSRRFLILVALMLLAAAAYADAVTVGGQTLPSASPHLRKETELLVPLAPALRALGMKVAARDNDVTITQPGGPTVRFTLGSTRVIADGKARDIRVAPQRVGDHVLLPVKATCGLLSLHLTGSAGGARLAITPMLEITTGRATDATIVTVRGAAPLVTKPMMLEDPPRAVFDFTGVALRQTGTIAVDQGLVTRLRTSWREGSPARLVVDLTKPVHVASAATAEGRVLTITIPDHAIPRLTVILDPGHGGSDPGTIGVDGTQEKSINLDVTLRVAKLLRAEGATVLMTREDDHESRPAARAAWANTTGADCYIAIHCNAAINDPIANGTRSYYHADDSRRLAILMHTALLRGTTLADGGIHHAGFTVIAATTMPAVLLELGFLSNPQECVLLNRAEYRQQVAEGIARGVVAYAYARVTPPAPAPVTPPAVAPPASVAGTRRTTPE